MARLGPRAVGAWMVDVKQQLIRIQGFLPVIHKCCAGFGQPEQSDDLMPISAEQIMSTCVLGLQMCVDMGIECNCPLHPPPPQDLPPPMTHHDIPHPPPSCTKMAQFSDRQKRRNCLETRARPGNSLPRSPQAAARNPQYRSSTCRPSAGGRPELHRGLKSR